MTDSIRTIVDDTLAAYARQADHLDVRGAAAFQWPWNIAKAGAEHLGKHGGAVTALVSGGGKVAASPSGASIIAGVKAGPKNPANTDRVLDDGLFGPALDAVKADQLLRTVFIGFGGGGQGGLVGGSGAAGIAYDIIDTSNRAAVSFSEFDLGIGAKASAGLTVGALSAEPRALNDSTNLWSFGATLVAVGVYVQVIMRSKDLSLIGFAMTLGGGAGLASSTGYGNISAT